MKWIFYKNLSEFKPEHLYEVLKLRQDIFIIEQDCIYDDLDGLDHISAHLLMQNNDDQLIGYLRIVPAGKKFKEVSLGRIAVRIEERGNGYGKELIRKGIEKALDGSGTAIKIEAQAHLEKYYSGFGFSTSSEVYDVDGIPHLQMVLEVSV